jgi:hypothetical protein
LNGSAVPTLSEVALVNYRLVKCGAAVIDSIDRIDRH